MLESSLWDQVMRKTVLLFPDTTKMAEFIMQYRASNAEVNSVELTLTALLSEEQIVAACTAYEAVIKAFVPA